MVEQLYALDDGKNLIPILLGSRRVTPSFTSLAELFDMGLVMGDSIYIRIMYFGANSAYRFQNVIGVVTQVQADAIFFSAHGRCQASSNGVSTSAKYTLSTNTLEVTMYNGSTFVTVSGVAGAVTDGMAVQWD